MERVNGQPLHNTQTLCNTLWGHNLSFRPFVRGDNPIPFTSLWPDKKTFCETYREANLEKAAFELCQLLVATNSVKSLEGLLEQSVLQAGHSFKAAGNMTLAHMVCAVGTMEMVNMLVQRCGSNTNGIWTRKDEEEHTAREVCFSQDIRRNLPGSSLFHRSKIPVGQPLKQEDKDRIFQLATQHNGFYKIIVQLQMYLFDVNTVRDSNGDLLIHLAVKGGLPSLPLLCVLVNTFKADVNLRDGTGHTPLCLAAKLGEQKLAEVLVCVFGAEINATDTGNKWTPLHYAVQYNHPKVVSMLVLRGADVGCEDKNHRDPSFLARQKRAHECRQIIQQHISERLAKLAAQAKDGSLKVNSLYTSDICAVTSEGCTLLMLAVMNNRVEIVEDLLTLPSCPLDFRQLKMTEGLASSMSDSFKGPPQQPADPECSLKTAAHHAAERGHTKCLQLLLNAGTHPSMFDANFMIPLHYAIDNNHVECVKVVLNYSNQNLALSGLRPAMNIAEGHDNEEIKALLSDAFDRRQREVVTPRLFEVARSGHKELIFQILENGDDMNPTNESHDWPLLLAAGFGYLDIVIQLYEFGGHVTHHHKISRSTPLHVAARGGHKNVVEWLLQFCRNPHTNKTPSISPLSGEEMDYLDINDRNAVMATPLELAATQGHSKVVMLLLDHGATTMLPDRDGRLISCPAFAGTQFLIESYRKERLKRIISTLRTDRLQLQDFEKLWKGPSDFNLRKKNGDSVLMVAAEHAPPSVVQFLIESAKTCKPHMLVSTSGQPPPLCPPQTSSPSPEDNSDHLSERSLPGTLSRDTRPHIHYSSDDERPMSTVHFRHNEPARSRVRKTEGSVSSRMMRAKDRHRRGERPPHWRRRPSSPTTTDTSDDEVKMNGDTSDNDTASSSGLHTAIIRLASLHDGQTALHRAAAANQAENVSLLLRADPECANLQDNDGNTALHLACNKAHKPTVKALLSSGCVDSSLRNKKFEYPEHGSIKTNIKKMVCKHRETLIKQSLPTPPSPSPMKQPPVVTTISNGYHHKHGELSHISRSASSDLAWTAFQERLEELKSRPTKKNENSSSD